MNNALRGPELKAHITSVAATLFYSEGVNSVGVDRVADKAGVTKRTLYHHFASKDALIAEAVRSMPIVPFPNTGSPIARIFGAFESLRSYLLDSAFRGCPYIIFSAELTSRNHPARRLIERRILKRRKWFETRLEEAGAYAPAPLAEELDVLFDGALASATKRGTLDPVDAALRAARVILSATSTPSHHPTTKHTRTHTIAAVP
jgi:AcrR family transcriptional regulator